MKNEIFKTKRLLIRSISTLDLEETHDLLSSPEIDKFNTAGIPENILESKSIVDHWISNSKSFVFAIETLEERKFIGLIGINLGKEKYRNAEVWFKIKTAFWNKGFATEALKQIISFGFENLSLHRIEAGCAIDNIGSIKVLEKVGMTKEAHTRKLLPLKSGWSDNYGYAILSTD